MAHKVSWSIKEAERESEKEYLACEIKHSEGSIARIAETRYLQPGREGSIAVPPNSESATIVGFGFDPQCETRYYIFGLIIIWASITL